MSTAVGPGLGILMTRADEMYGRLGRHIVSAVLLGLSSVGVGALDRYIILPFISKGMDLCERTRQLKEEAWAVIRDMQEFSPTDRNIVIYILDKWAAPRVKERLQTEQLPEDPQERALAIDAIQSEELKKCLAEIKQLQSDVAMGIIGSEEKWEAIQEEAKKHLTSCLDEAIRPKKHIYYLLVAAVLTKNIFDTCLSCFIQDQMMNAIDYLGSGPVISRISNRDDELFS